METTVNNVAVKDTAELRERAVAIRDAVMAKSVTAGQVGSLFIDLIETCAVVRDMIDAVGGVTGDVLVADPATEGFSLNTYTGAGTYRITGERVSANDGLPIGNAGSGHTVDAVLQVLDSSLHNSDECCVTQVLTLSNRVGGDGVVYVRTAQGTAEEIKGGGKWEAWQRMQGVRELGATMEATVIDECRESGMYGGVIATGLEHRGLALSAGDTFLIVTVNGYAIAQTGLVPQCTQLLYRLPASTGTGVRVEAGVYTSTGVWTGTSYEWGSWRRYITEPEFAGEVRRLQGQLATLQAEGEAVAGSLTCTKQVVSDIVDVSGFEAFKTYMATLSNLVTINEDGGYVYDKPAMVVGRSGNVTYICMSAHITPGVVLQLFLSPQYFVDSAYLERQPGLTKRVLRWDTATGTMTSIGANELIFDDWKGRLDEMQTEITENGNDIAALDEKIEERAPRSDYARRFVTLDMLPGQIRALQAGVWECLTTGGAIGVYVGSYPEWAKFVALAEDTEEPLYIKIVKAEASEGSIGFAEVTAGETAVFKITVTGDSVEEAFTKI